MARMRSCYILVFHFLAKFGTVPQLWLICTFIFSQTGGRLVHSCAIFVGEHGHVKSSTCEDVFTVSMFAAQLWGASVYVCARVWNWHAQASRQFEDLSVPLHSAAFSSPYPVSVILLT